jgi:hypothetical protein
MLRVLVLSAGAAALQPRAQTTLDALKTSRRQLLPLASFLFAPPAYAASSEELKAMMGGLQNELSEENLAKARGVADEKPLIELPSIKAPSIKPPREKPAPKEKKERAKKESSGDGLSLPSVDRIQAPDIGGAFGNFGEAQKEAGRRKAEAIRAAKEAAKSPEMAPAPANVEEVAGGAVYDQLRAKRDAQRAAAEANAEERAFKRLTPTEQRKARAAGR